MVVLTFVCDVCGKRSRSSPKRQREGNYDTPPAGWIAEPIMGPDPSCRWGQKQRVVQLRVLCSLRCVDRWYDDEPRKAP